MTDEKKSLWSMLNRLNEAEDDLIFLTDEELKELLGDLKGKVDGIKYMIDKLEGEESRLASVIKAHQERKKAVKGSIDRLKKYSAMVLDGMETPELYGNEFDMKISRSKKVVSLISEPTPEHELMFPNCVSTKLTWSKEGLKQELKNENESLKDIAKIEETKSIRFSSHKEVK